MAEEATVKRWGKRFTLIAGAAAAVTAVIGVGTAAFQSYQSLQEARQAKQDNATSYAVLVSKVNAMAERLAYVEGACGARGPEARPPVMPTVSAPLPEPTAMTVEVDSDGIPDKPAKAERPMKFKVNAYQQLPQTFEGLRKSKQAYAE